MLLHSLHFLSSYLGLKNIITREIKIGDATPQPFILTSYLGL
jgi:hypothetical protein